MSEKQKFKVKPNGSFARWGIAARTNYELVRPNEFGIEKTIEVDKSPTNGYAFQYNGHTGFDLDFKDSKLTFRGGNVQKWDGQIIEGISLSVEEGIPTITFNVTDVRFKIPKRAQFVKQKDDKKKYPITYGLDADDLEKYWDEDKSGSSKKPAPGEADWFYIIKMIKGARFLMTSSATLPNQTIALGGGHFKFLPDGILRRYVGVRASSITGIARDVEILDTYYVRRAGEGKKRVPIIVANAGYWRDGV